MAIEFFTGFETCSNVNQARAFFDYVLDLSFSTSGGFENSASLITSTTGSFRKNVSHAKTKAVGYHCSATEANDAQTMMGFTLSDNTKITIRNATTGCKVMVNSTVVATCTEYFDASLQHFECEVFSDAITGYVIVKKNGVEIINATELNTVGNDIIEIERIWSASSQRMDNLYIADSLQGEIYAYKLIPNQDVSIQFAPSTGAENYPLLETNDGDSSYVQSSTEGHKDLYGFSDLPEGAIPIAVMVTTSARRSGTGQRYLQTICEHNTVEYEVSEPKLLSLSYPDSTENQPIVDMMPLAPDGTAWTREKVNDLKFGFKIPVTPAE
jgi:hypothetical protein